MVRYKCIIILIIPLIFFTAAETPKSEDRISAELKQPNKLYLQKSQPHLQRKEEPSILSKFANWIWSPFGGRMERHVDLIQDAGSYESPQYLPPQPIHHQTKQCNACNEVPWIPIAASADHQSVINFVPSNEYGGGGSSHSFGFFQKHQSPPDAYQQLPHHSPGLLYLRPKLHGRKFYSEGQPHSRPSKREHPSIGGDIVIAEYMLPPPVNYRIPSLLYGPPSDAYKPPKYNYGPPQEQYGTSNLHYSSTKQEYGPPKPQYSPPKPEYSPQKPEYGPPKLEYSLSKLQHGPPKPHKISHGPPFRPLSKTPYKQSYDQPIKNYNSYSTFNKNPFDQYGPPQPPLSMIYSTTVDSTQPSQAIPTSHLHPIDSTSGFWSTHPSSLDSSQIKEIPSAVPSDSYGAPITRDNLDYLPSHEPLASHSGQKNYFKYPIALPNLSLKPVLPIRPHGNFKQDGFISGEENRTPNPNVEVHQSVTLADYVASIDHPVNVIQSPVIEISVKNQYGIQDDNQDQKNQTAFNSDQSDYSFAVTSETTTSQPNFYTHNIDSYVNLYNTQIQNQQNFPQSVQASHTQKEQTFNNINEKLQDSTEISQHPIIVDDIHPAASNINSNISNSNTIQRVINNENSIKIISLSNKSALNVPQEQDFFKNKLIKQFLLKHNILKSNKAEIDDVNKLSQSIFLNNNTAFSAPPLEYNKWNPRYNYNIQTSMQPLLPTQGMTMSTSTTAKQPKPIQIIVPYVTNKKPIPFQKDESQKNTHRKNQLEDSYKTLLSMYTPPSTTDKSIWVKFVDDFNMAETQRATAKEFSRPTTAVYNIRDLIAGVVGTNRNEKLPYDIITLQKNIDDWTHQSYSNSSNIGSGQKNKENLPTSKQIPDKYLTTTYSLNEVTSTKTDGFDYQSAESINNDSVVSNESNELEPNLIVAADTTTEESTTASISSKYSALTNKDPRSLWNVSQISVSSYSKEKVYLVTPQTYSFITSTPATAWSMAPKIENGKVNKAYDTHKFSIRIEPENFKSEDKMIKENSAIKVVFSEWPHLINNLQTTTPKPTSRHPLFGLMDIPAYTPSPNSTVETFVGHSKVATVVTPSSARRQNKWGH